MPKTTTSETGPDRELPRVAQTVPTAEPKTVPEEGVRGAVRRRHPASERPAVGSRGSSDTASAGSASAVMDTP